jgi:hypothetical protein
MTKVYIKTKVGLDRMLTRVAEMDGTVLWLIDRTGYNDELCRIDRDRMQDRWMVKRDNCWSSRTQWTRKSLLERLFKALPSVWYN